VRSEGCGLVVLKPLAQAERDGDRIYAVILGTSSNNDGSSSGSMMAPSTSAQEAMIRQAMQVARVSPREIQYIEAHGTGTSAGDPVELRAISNVLGDSKGRSAPCRIGSVKTNIGHTEGAAGAAGLIKVALSLYHRYLPPTLHVAELTPAVPWDQMPIKLETIGEAWPGTGSPPRAGLRCFGRAGTNAHGGLEEFPRKDLPEAPAREACLLPITAATPEALKSLARSYASQLRGEGDSLVDICYTAANRRTHLEHRIAIIAGSEP